MKKIIDAREDIIHEITIILREKFDAVISASNEEKSELQKAFDDLYLVTAGCIGESDSLVHQKYRHLLRAERPLKVAPPLNDIVEVKLNGEIKLMYSCGRLSDGGEYLYCSHTKGGNDHPVREWRSIK